MNKVYYIKTDVNDQPKALQDALVNALYIAGKEGISNVKIYFSHSNLFDSDFLSSALDQVFPNNGEKFRVALKRNRAFPIIDFPQKGITTGVQALLTNNQPAFATDNTIVILWYSDFESLKKVESLLFRTSIKLIAVLLPHEDEGVKTILSATNAIDLSEPKYPVSHYNSTFSDAELDIINRLCSINITSNSSNHFTRETMNSVIRDLAKGKLFISYDDFLGFLLNTVNYNLNDSIDLLNWKGKYFDK